MRPAEVARVEATSAVDVSRETWSAVPLLPFGPEVGPPREIIR
jgi:hypothetical protein